MAIANGFARTKKTMGRALKGQAALVLEALDARDGVPATVEALTKDIVDMGLVTRQAPDRITSYYLCIFKKQGLVRLQTIETPDGDENVENVDAADENDADLENEGADENEDEDELVDA